MNNKTIDKYLNEGLAKGETDHIVYQFTGLKDDAEDVFANIESMMDDYVETYGENDEIKKALYKSGDAITKALVNFEKKVILPLKKKYK